VSYWAQVTTNSGGELCFNSHFFPLKNFKYRVRGERKTERERERERERSPSAKEQLILPFKSAQEQRLPQTFQPNLEEHQQ
jgi:hypothetical protein